MSTRQSTSNASEARSGKKDRIFRELGKLAEGIQQIKTNLGERIEGEAPIREEIRGIKGETAKMKQATNWVAAAFGLLIIGWAFNHTVSIFEAHIRAAAAQTELQGSNP